MFLAANAPDRVTSLTIGGGAVRFPIESGGALKDIIEAPSLDDVRQLDARTNIGYAVRARGRCRQRARCPRGLRQRPRPRPLRRVRPLRPPLSRAEPGAGDLLPTITTPALITAGHDDDLVPWSNDQYLADLLANSELHPLDAGHFAWEQASDEYGRLIVDWVTGGFRRLRGAVTA